MNAVQAKALSYSSIHRSIASSTNTKSTLVNVLAICLNLGLKPARAARIRRRDSEEMLFPNAGALDDIAAYSLVVKQTE